METRPGWRGKEEAELSSKRKPSLHRSTRRFRRPPPGSLPGTVAPHEAASSTSIQAICYSADKVAELLIDDVEEIRELLGSYDVTWISVSGLKNVELIRQIAQIFEIHSLALEDSFNLHQRPKAEPYDKHLYIVANMLRPHPDEFFKSDQISLFVGKNYVLSFKDAADDCLDPVRDRIRRQLGKLRVLSADYLAYSIVDTIIDHYFPIADQCANIIDEYEDLVMQNDNIDIIRNIYEFKTRLDSMYQVIWNHKEMINFIIRHEEGNFSDETKIFFRDCQDHTMQLLEFLMSSREAATSLIRLQLNLESQRSNEVMKFLTIMASLFLPLTFITGLYGMNFRTDLSPFNMPELNWYMGYPFSLLVMTASTVGLLGYFRFKGWISFRSIWNPRGQVTTTDVQKKIVVRP
jgi:magnesium transporter